jgi:predicted enzyme related to lactoylglutathione lyase
MANRVIHFEIQADDVQRAQDFYKNVLGWEFTQAMTKEEGGMDYFSIRTGQKGEPGINGGLYQRPQEKPLHTFDCTVEVEDIEKVADSILKNGGTITMPKSQIPGVGWFVGALDTEGNRVGFMQPTEWRAE